MLIIGPIASIFDFLTFYLLLRWFGSKETLFHTGWFIESLAPQMLTIFAIRTRKRLFTSWPHPIVSILAVGMAAFIMVLPFTPLGVWVGLIPMPPSFFLFVAAVTVCYFSLLETVKYWFYHHFV
jgi:P-type Mg2+ transporter